MADEAQTPARPFIDVPEHVVDSLKQRGNPVSFEDHFSQVRMFYMSLDPTEQAHVRQAYSFELGKCASDEIRSRQLQALANIDAELCAAVAQALGLPTPEASLGVHGNEVSPAVSQIGASWPVDGRVLGIVASHATPAATVETLLAHANQAGMKPLLLVPTGGTLRDGSPVDRTLLTARSVEFDALIIAESLQQGADAQVDLDAKAGTPAVRGSERLDPRFVLLLQECYRQSKAMVWMGNGPAPFEAAGLPQGTAGLVSGSIEDAVAKTVSFLSTHRVWERFGSHSEGP